MVSFITLIKGIRSDCMFLLLLGIQIIIQREDIVLINNSTGFTRAITRIMMLFVVNLLSCNSRTSTHDLTLHFVLFPTSTKYALLVHSGRLLFITSSPGTLNLMKPSIPSNLVVLSVCDLNWEMLNWDLLAVLFLLL